jgi:hypothetical protein
MVKTFFALLLAIVLLQSCCIRRPTHAQSDRFDTHHPRTPIIECIPCATVKNSATTTLWTEAWGVSNQWMVGIEPGYNFNHVRLFADAGTHWWPSGNMTWAHREQVGIALFNPDLFIRPEFGAGLHQRYYRSEVRMQTSSGEQFVRTPTDFYWQGFGGLRCNVPYSNIEISARVYRLQNLNTAAHDWNFGIQLAFRL